MTHERYGHHPIGRVVGSVAVTGVLLVAGFAGTARAHNVALKPARGGSYAFRLANAPDCLDPQKTAEGSSDEIDSYILDGLLSLNNKGRYVGDLATRYKSSDGGKKITFVLRRGVRFSNGDPFNAAAVKYTFDRGLNPATKSPVTSGDLASVSAVKVLNNYSVQLVLKTPNRPLLGNLAGGYTGILDPKATRSQGRNSCQAPVGTGPYMVKSVGPAFSTVTLVANPHHTWAPSWVHNKGKPYITTVQFKSITSDATAISELLTGGIDIAPIPGTQLNRVKGHKSIALKRLPSESVDFLSFNTAHAPFNNVQVRRAVAALINRSSIVKAALNGQGKPDYSPLPPAIPFYDKNLKSALPAYNVSQAARVIAANHATGPYDLLATNDPTTMTIAEVIQAAAAQAGMQLKIDPKALADYVPAAAKGQFDINLLAYTYPDPDILYLLMNSTQGGGAGLNFTGYKNAVLDELTVAGRTTLSAKKASKIYREIQVFDDKNALIIGLVSPTSLLGVNARIKGYHTDSEGGIAIQDLYIREATQR